jgi:hypothetical protein
MPQQKSSKELPHLVNMTTAQMERGAKCIDSFLTTSRGRAGGTLRIGKTVIAPNIPGLLFLFNTPQEVKYGKQFLHIL